MNPLIHSYEEHYEYTHRHFSKGIFTSVEDRQDDGFCGYVYSIRNNINGKRYIGSSMNCKARFQQHLSGLKGNRHYAKDMQYDYNRYGDVFSIEILGEYNSQMEMEYWEKRWMVAFRTYYDKYGYNVNDKSMVSVRRQAGLEPKIPFESIDKRFATIQTAYNNGLPLEDISIRYGAKNTKEFVCEAKQQQFRGE